MALYTLPFAPAEWREDAALGVTVPEDLRERVEASAALEGVPADAWIVRALSRCLDPRLLEVTP